MQDNDVNKYDVVGETKGDVLKDDSMQMHTTSETLKEKKKLLGILKKPWLWIIVLSCIGIAVSGGSKEEDLNKIVSLEKEIAELQGQKKDAENSSQEVSEELANLQKEYDTHKDTATVDLAKVTAEYADYKEKMKPFEELSVEQAEAGKRKLQEEKAAAEAAEAEKAAAEKAAKEEKEAAEKAAAEAEKAKGYETGITYDQLARNPDDYKGKLVKFSGKVLQVMEGGSEHKIRLAVNSDYDTVILVGYDPTIISSRILDDDKITIYGTSAGVYSYESTGGATITIPAVLADKIEG